MRHYIKHSHIAAIQAAYPQLKIKDCGPWGYSNIPKAIAEEINAADPNARSANSIIHNITKGFSS